MANTTSPESFPLTSLLALVWRRRLLAIATALSVAGLVLLSSFSISPLYRAEALLVVERGSKPLDFLKDESDAGSKGTEFSLLNTQSELLMSNQVIGQVIASEPELFGGSPLYSSTKNPVQLLRNRLNVETNQYNWIIHLSLKDGNPDLAKNALAALIRCHLQNEDRRLEERSRSALEFLKVAVEKARSDLASCRAEESAFRRKNGLLSTNPEHNLLTLEIEGLNRNRVDLVTRVAASEVVVQAIAACDAAPTREEILAGLLRILAIQSDPQVAQQRQTLATVTARTFELGLKYKPAHPLMQDAAKQLVQAQAQLGEAVTAARGTITEAHKALLDQKEELARNIAELEAKLTDYREKLIDLQVLSLKTASTEQLFRTVDRNLHEEEIASRRQHQVVTVADPPHVTSAPIGIRRSLFLLAGVVLGIFAGIITPLAVEALDRRIRNPQAVRQITNLPTLGYIPHVEKLIMPGRPGTSPPLNPAIDESFRLLSSAIQLSREVKHGSRVLVITSPGSGDGRTTVATRLAMTLAASGSQVLLIDGDLRQPALHHQFQLPEEAGVSDLLQGRPAMIVPTGYPRLEILLAGTPSDRSMELPSIQSFRELVETFAGTNRFTIIDSPPLEFS